eukprot:TRINITY_DN13855_c0_g1_i1.p1 TRINITY_DN13855_c0_g1~~TRINITY_DN13855_c0_g1_i1.p1  ORF type:complete len:127 (-),score=15.94 TRINITY_DN13855_c0_g1_i1:262-642(-)
MSSNSGPSVFVLWQLFQGADLFHRLDKRSILHLTLTCKEISKLVRSLISEYWIFNFARHGNGEFQPTSYYSPKTVKLLKVQKKTVLNGVRKLILENEFDEPFDFPHLKVSEIIFGVYYNSPFVSAS